MEIQVGRYCKTKIKMEDSTIFLLRNLEQYAITMAKLIPQNLKLMLKTFYMNQIRLREETSSLSEFKTSLHELNKK